MPCLNEARTVGTCVAKARTTLDRLGVAGEVVIADNGSTDDSPEIARREGARVVHVERKGYGSALQGGIAAARGQYVIMGDADDSYDFTALEPFIQRLRQGDDLVMGNRFKGGIAPGAMPWLHRYVGNPVLTGILNFFFHTPIRDAHCGLRGFRKDSYDKLELSTPGMEFASEMVVKATLLGQKITEVPTTLHPDGRDRPPHLRSFRDGWRHLRFLLLMCPFWLYLIPSLLLFGLGASLWTWLGPATPELTLPTQLLGGLCGVLGYQTLWLWLHARTYGLASGLYPASLPSATIVKKITLERGLIVGSLVFVGALAWMLATFPGALWCHLALLLGGLTMANSFLLGLLGMKRNTK